MRVTREQSYMRTTITLWPFSDNRSVVVERRRDWVTKEFYLPVVFWSGFGNTDAQTARKWAHAILKACDIADEMVAGEPNA